MIAKRVLVLVLTGSCLAAAHVAAPSSVAAPQAQAGEKCSQARARNSSLVCIRTPTGLRWQQPYKYQAEACNPSDPRLAGIILPEASRPEARVAAACVALEWLANKDLSCSWSATTLLEIPRYSKDSADLHGVHEPS